jgi:hypothetical protein
MGVGFLGGRTWWGACSEIQHGRSALEKKEYISAILHYEKAILWKFPYPAYRREASEQIQFIQQLARHQNNVIVERYADQALSFSQDSTGNQARDSNLPNPLWSVIAGFSFLAWIGTIFLLIAYSFDQQLHLKNKKYFWILSTITLFMILLWLTSLKLL